MQLKTVSSFGLAFLLVVGVVGVASAQVEVAATQGILIRVDAPKANEWAAIGDTIRIRVLCYAGRLDDGFQDCGGRFQRCRRRPSEPMPILQTKIYYNIASDLHRSR